MKACIDGATPMVNKSQGQDSICGTEPYFPIAELIKEYRVKIFYSLHVNGNEMSQGATDWLMCVF